MADQEKINWIRLARTPGVGPKTLATLINYHATATRTLEEALPRFKASPPSAAIIEQEINLLRRSGAQAICSYEDTYPEALRHIPDAPPVLYCRGRIDLLKTPSLGIVGSRNASLVGKKMSKDMAQELGKNGFTVVSGLARGIDTAAHEGSYSSGTVAAIAGGIDQIYPLENKNLYERLYEEGLVITESPLGVLPQGALFPKRNRLISGLSKGVIIVEAAIKSGSLITARYALEQNRDVFAVPGHPMDPRAQGCNDLLKQGAILVTSAEDILNHYQTSSKVYAVKESEPLEIPTYTQEVPHRLLEDLSFTPISLDLLLEKSHLPFSVVQYALLELEIAGRIEQHPGGKIALR